MCNRLIILVELRFRKNLEQRVLNNFKTPTIFFLLLLDSRICIPFPPVSLLVRKIIFGYFLINNSISSIHLLKFFVISSIVNEIKLGHVKL